MERNFYSDEFEQLIREKTEQYKMYPSEKVWKGVYSSLHTKKRWFIAGMSLLITGIIFLAGKELIAPASHPGLAKKAMIAANVPATRTSPENAGQPRVFSEMRRAPRSSSSSINDHIASPSPGQSSDDQQLADIALIDPVIGRPDPSSILTQPIDANVPVTIVPGSVNPETSAAGVTANAGTTATAGGNGTMGIAAAESGNGQRAENKESGAIAARPVKSRIERSTQLIPLINDPSADADKVLPENAGNGGLDASSPAQKELAGLKKINWLRDYAVYNLHPSPARNRKYWQFYFAPTVNYRTLSGGDYFGSKSIVQNAPLSLTHLGEAKDYVNHTPALGFEAGSNLSYRVTRNLTLKAGFQFSYSRYTIKAYAASPERATIALGTTLYGYIMDSISNYSSIRNFGGRKEETLNNEYFQLSAPVGFELRIMGNERLQVNIAATIQPTYLLNTNSYLLTTDYASYTSEPSLFRRWNVNTGVEAFLTYKTSSGIRWQIGPEFRYQLLSTYNSSYPIHENLKGYGIKIGITKVIP